MKLATLLAFLLLVLGCPASAAETREGPRLEVAEDGTIRASFHGADLRAVLCTLARAGKFQLVLDESVQGRVDAEIDGVPWADALRAILRSHGLAAEVDGRLWLGADPGYRPGFARVSSDP